MGRVRLHELAKRHGVSVSTASRALSGKPGVSAELRRNLVEAAREVGYPLPGSLQGKESAGGSQPGCHHRLRPQPVHCAGARRHARARVGAWSCAAHDQPARRWARGARGDLARIGRPRSSCSPSTTPRSLAHRARAGLPAVLVNGDDPWMRLDSVAPCNRSAARLATDHLLACGHRELLFLQCPGRTTIQRRLEGWRDALQRCRAAGRRSPRTERGGLGSGAGRGSARPSSRHGGVPFTAVLCAADSLAGGAMAALEARGLKVPGDISVMGMDDLPMVELWSPPLTTVHIPSRELGGIALDTVRHQIDGRIGPPRRVELACRLVLRGSVAPRSPSRHDCNPPRPAAGKT